MRRLVRGMPGMLVAALVLLARLIAPATATVVPANAADPFALAALQTLCHAAAPNDPTDHAPGPVPAQHDCFLCPACHLASHAALPAPAGPVLAAPALMPAGLAVLLPPATGPPSRARAVAQPTGPPTLSV